MQKKKYYLFIYLKSYDTLKVAQFITIVIYSLLKDKAEYTLKNDLQ